MARNAQISPEEMLAMKEDIWNGFVHAEIMEKYKVSYQTPVMVKAGRLYEYIPWPDGSTGRMNEKRVQELAKSTRFTTKQNRAAYRNAGMPSYGNGATALSPEDRELINESDRRARALGYANLEALMEEKRREIENERAEKAEREQQAKNDTYDEREAAWIAAGRPKEPRKVNPDDLPDDQVNPDANEKLEWDDVVALGAKVPVVEIAVKDVNEEEPALKPALRIVLKHFPPRQWKEDHVLRMVYSIKAKIERFWDVTNKVN